MGNGLGSSRQGEFHPKPLTEPYLKVSPHTALVIQISTKVNKKNQVANGRINMDIASLLYLTIYKLD